MMRGRRLKIALLTAHTLQDRRQSSWAGTVDYMARALQRHCGDVYPIGMVHSRRKLLGKALNGASQLVLKKRFAFNHTFSLAREYANMIDPVLTGHSFDLIVAPSCGTEIAFLQSALPIVLIEDATFALLHNYYPQYSNLLTRSVREIHALEGLAIKRANAVLYTSEWASRSAIQDYHADPQKVHVLAFGANLDPPPSKETLEAKKKPERCRLLFVGADWCRKGGGVAFETLLQLESMGIEAELLVLGCLPPKTLAHARMKVIPYLDKRDEREHRELCRLFETASFLILPTRSDCVPMVLGEANAFGLPAIASRTGGIPGIIREGENGFMLPLGATGADYARVIAGVYRDDARYAALVQSSRAAFDARLNWDAWGGAVANIARGMLG